LVLLRYTFFLYGTVALSTVRLWPALSIDIAAREIMRRAGDELTHNRLAFHATCLYDVVSLPTHDTLADHAL